jgi:hypothetical protein
LVLVEDAEADLLDLVAERGGALEMATGTLAFLRA